MKNVLLSKMGTHKINAGKIRQPKIALDKVISFSLLREHAITRDEVRRRCPMAVEYGSATEPYYHRDDLADLFNPKGGAAS
jgi:hypothetical protein